MKYIHTSVNLVLILFLFTFSGYQNMDAQNTVGVIINDGNIQDGYTLFTIHKQTYLINNCGEVVNQWTSEYKPGNAVYLLPNGDLLRAGNTESENFQFGGNGGIIQKFSWEGDILWEYRYDNEEHRQHHDIYPMPNGNVLILAATLVTGEEAIASGRDPSKLDSGHLYNERIVEVEPIGSTDGIIQWEWNFVDHVIQDFDPTKKNYGDISQNPQLVDFNYTQNDNGLARWLHINSIQYYEKFDQIVLSSRFLNEIYIIDHSTTTSEAASSSGGTYGKGGDFLYRWGNPQTYDQGTEEDRKLGGQHHAHFIPDGLKNEGKLILFNNDYSENPDQSAVFILDLPQSSPGVYNYLPDTPFGPEEPFNIYTNGSDFYSPVVSSAQVLANGNSLYCEGRFGTITEVDESNNIVWKYIIPVNSDDGTILSQGDDISMETNLTFRATKYPLTYTAFNDKLIELKPPIENNPNSTSCSTLSFVDSSINTIQIYPNPASQVIFIKSDITIDTIELYDILGKKINLKINNNKLFINHLRTGLYFLVIQSDSQSMTKKVMIVTNN